MLVLICHINLLLKTLRSYIENNCAIPFAASKVQNKEKKKILNDFVGYNWQDVRGLTLPVGRAILSAALGRENVVHIGVADRAAADRVGHALTRWLHFIGPDPDHTPSATAAQGVSTGGPVPPVATGRDEFEDVE